MSSLAAKLKKGTKVKITAKGDFFNQPGIVKYVGPIQQKKADGDYVGLQLQKPIGKNNGTHGGKQYFKTKQNHGIFLKPTSIAYMDGTPVASAPTTKAQTSNQLSKDLQQAEKPKVEEPKIEQSQKTEPEMKQKEKQTETGGSDLKSQNDELKKRIKSLEQQNRGLKIQNQKVKYAVKQKEQGKQKQLVEQIEFFKSQKQVIQKQKADLKKKNAQLNAELEEYAENIGMVDTLTIKIETLQAKNQKLKQQLQNANTELKNYKASSQNKGKSESQLNENIKILNETITLLESDLKQMTEKVVDLQYELQKKTEAEKESKKLERKVKQKQQQLQQMKNELQLVSDAAAFAEKLTLDMLKKEQQLKQKTVKLTEYITKIETLQQEMAINKQFTDELNQQIFHQQQLMDKSLNQIEQKNKHISQLNRQIEKYKKKIFQITQSNETLASMASQISEQKEEVPVSRVLYGDQYQSKYFSILKVNNAIRKNELKHLIQFSQIRNYIGVNVLNLYSALPQSFTSKFYPQVISILVSLKCTNDRLYYIFNTSVDTFINRSNIYSKQNQQLAQWLILLMKEVITLFSCLQKIQYAFITVENQEQISAILQHRILKFQISKANNFALQILQKFVDDNISASIDLQPFVSSIQKFDQIGMGIKQHFSKQLDTKMNLCSQGMQTVTSIIQAIMKYKQTNPLGQNAQVDNALQLFMKTVLSYLKQCCMNPHIRYKSEMREYLGGLQIINNIFKDIDIQDNYHELNSLYSESENIKLLRETILTTQFHANSLENDLKDIIYPNQVSKIQTTLDGSFWQQRLKLIKEQLLKVKQLTQEKQQLELALSQAKKKNLILERDNKDKQSTKELYQKRIGQLQLKVQQVTSVENQNKRQAEKIKSYEDSNKIIEQQIINLTKKGKTLEQENKKLKQKYEALQTQSMMRNVKKQRNNASMMSSEDVASLGIFKNAIKENNLLKTFEVKKKLMALKQSPIFLMKSSNNIKKQQQTKLVIARAKAFDQISKFSINDPFSSKRNQNQANLDAILLQIDKLKGTREQGSKKQKPIKVGILNLSLLSSDSTKMKQAGLSIVVN